jgi:hypothetical protein
VASIGDLLARLEQHVHDLDGRHADDTVLQHVAGWKRLARPTLRAIGELPLGGRRELTHASLDAVLRPLARGPRQPLPDAVLPASRLATAGQIMGAIADVLADTTRISPSPGLVGGEAVKLQTSLLAAVHQTARWSRATLDSQALASTRHALMLALDDLALVTEPWALVPPGRRVSALENLSLPSRAAPGLPGATAAWAQETLPVLQGRYRVTGWAMQATASSLALLSQLTRAAVLRAYPDGNAPGGSEALTPKLAQAARAWRAAATWPPNLRLGGSTHQLRSTVRDLREACETAQPSVAVMRHVLDLALPVAQTHALTMKRLMDKHELWIKGAIPGDTVYSQQWVREPRGSRAGTPMLQSAEHGLQALTEAVWELDHLPARDRGEGSRLWPRVAVEAMRRPEIERTPLLAVVDRSVGQEH